MRPISALLMALIAVLALTDQVQSECGIGEYTRSDGKCGNCYYYCITCDGVPGFYNCPLECGCFNNNTGDCDVRNCGGCLAGYKFDTYGFCKCENPLHCCGEECQTCGAPGQCEECRHGRYGPLCQNRCSENCVRCDELDGCTECDPGTFGDTCTENCREECTECSGYDNCTKCITGHFGIDCSQTCRDECVTCTDYDYCTSCVEGRFGMQCGNSCRENCISCQDYDDCTECINGKYDNICASDCEAGCKTCVSDGSYVCKECYPGRYGYNCEYSCDNKCRDNICNKANGHCQNGCIDGYYLGSNRRTCYKCPYTCTKCSDSDDCSECTLWRYGWRCTQQCLGCMDGLCDITSGQCILGCKDGYFNSSGQCSKCPENCLNCTSTTSCTYCDTGKYGHACESACDKCKDGICDIDTGACTNGCVDPYYINANSECDQCRWTCASCTSHDSCDQCTSHEFWGPNCLYYCANCLAGCDKNDGCTYGCDVGYFKHYNDTMDGYQCHTCPDRCSECTDYDYGNCSKCSRNSWGLTCEYSCIGCKDDLCSRNEGCVNGCSKGYFPRGNHSAGSLCEGCLVGCEACSNDHSCLGCKPGLFGDRCQHLCSENDSKCIECELETLTCSKCQDGFFPGRNACEPCSKNCVEGSQPYCSPDSGVCIHGCDSNSFWGLACEYDCTGCGYDVCDRTSGCLRGCLNGYFLTKTENIYTEYHCEPCASNCETCHNASSCISCDIRFYGESCESPCNSGLDKCIRCAGYGTDDFRCLECEEWYFPSVGACKPCSVHCLGGHWPSCTQSSGVCVRGCKEGWQGKRCDRAICMVENCNTCVFDNSSMCVECQFGFYGDTNAQVCTRCPDTCASGTTCNRESGSCDYGCRDGLSGSRCDQKCNSRCAQCAQYNKDFCNTCKLWFYGNICEHSCSVNCKELGDEQICDKSTGRCLHGCKDAFSGSNCSISCNEGCKGQLCDGISGQCLNGCERGHWGITCSATCSAGCRDQDCNSTIGFCQAGCKDGFEGAFCEAISGYQPEAQQDGPDIGLVVGLSVGLSIVGVIAIVAVVAIYLMLRKRRRQSGEGRGNMQVLYTQNPSAYSVM